MHLILFQLCHRYQPDGLCTDLRKFIDGPSHYLTLPPELKSAVEAICYIAEQLQAEKDYEAVRDLHLPINNLGHLKPSRMGFIIRDKNVRAFKASSLHQPDVKLSSRLSHGKKIFLPLLLVLTCKPFCSLKVRC